MKKIKSLNFNLNMGKLISSAHNMMTKRFVQNAHEAGLDISLDQWMVLGPISYHKNASQKVLSDACLKDKTSITKIVNTLEKKNLVSSEVFNIGTGRNYTINQVADLVGGEKSYIPSRSGEARETMADISKATQILGWSPNHRLEDTVLSY